MAALQVKICKEQQVNKQVQMNTELKKLRKELEGLNVCWTISKNSQFA